MSKKDKQRLYARLRTHLPSFIAKTFGELSPNTPFMDNYHIHAMAYYLLAVYRGDIKRLIITIPPRNLKSISVSVAFVAWVLGLDPTRQFICISYEQGLSIKFSNFTRMIMESDWYKELFPKTRIDPKKNTESLFMTTQKGGRFSTSIGASVTGHGADLILIDDSLNAGDAASDIKRDASHDFITKSVFSRLNNKKKGGIVIIGQRLHDDDTTGRLIEKGGWVHLNLPAIAEVDEKIRIGKDSYHVRKVGDLLHAEREPKEVLDQLREEMGSYDFAAQYQQNPAPLGGGLLKWKWFRWYDQPPLNAEGALIVQSWDTANTVNEMSDYSVCTTWLFVTGNYYLLDIYREKLEYPDLRKQVRVLAKHWNVGLILIEKSTGSLSLLQELHAQTSLNILPITPKGDKGSRMITESPAIEAGRVWLPNEQPWLAEFQREVVTFSRGKHDDQIDSLSQFLYWARHRELDAYAPKARVTLCGGDMPDLYFGGDDW